MFKISESFSILNNLTSMVFLAGCPSLSSLSPVAWTPFIFFSLSSNSLITPCSSETTTTRITSPPSLRQSVVGKLYQNITLLLYRVVFLLGCHVGVSFTPVVVHLLLLFLVQPHQLFSGCSDEGVELVQVAQTGFRGILQGSR